MSRRAAALVLALAACHDRGARPAARPALPPPEVRVTLEKVMTAAEQLANEVRAADAARRAADVAPHLDSVVADDLPAGFDALAQAGSRDSDDVDVLRGGVVGGTLAGSLDDTLAPDPQLPLPHLPIRLDVALMSNAAGIGADTVAELSHRLVAAVAPCAEDALGRRALAIGATAMISLTVLSGGATSYASGDRALTECLRAVHLRPDLPADTTLTFQLAVHER